ncbi:MAG TPA: prepilin-type N-terminal cleavage/methylation domain-containing protein [Tepidisphaeraceae bacterium]|nr:prepilin-type N-terminal cleavage/methylation domain-containing protein [Tepidisphaeraceae bacterium]
MTFAVSATSSRDTRRAFTLVELLVVIGIIVVLVGILTPAVMKAYRSATRARIAADLNTIATALESYKSDFGDYPRPDSSGAGAGFASLGRYLIGPYGNPASFIPPVAPYLPGDCLSVGSSPNITEYVCVHDTSTGPPTADWAIFGFNDGHDGPGYQKKLVGQYRGKVYGPYLQPDKFKTRGLAVLDSIGNPILYFPASPAHNNINVLGGYVGTGNTSEYNFNDNLNFFHQVADTDATTNATYRIKAMLGDCNTNGQVDSVPYPNAPSETAAATVPYLLWSAGPDGLFGPTTITQGASVADYLVNFQQIQKCDDVTNFSK